MEHLRDGDLRIEVEEAFLRCAKALILAATAMRKLANARVVGAAVDRDYRPTSTSPGYAARR
jgi:hypothetical protein